MRKLFTLSIAVLLSVFSINAQYVMKVTLKNGQEKEFDTSEIENIIWPENEDAPETHEWVDLGLPSGTKWATCNVGASSPEEYGGYYAWGEVTEKSYYSWDTYAYGSDWDDCQYIGSEISGTEYDVAHVKWGDEWRMPTYADWTELMEYCSYEWATKSGINGYVITSNSNGNEIFLPAAGYKTDNSTSNVGKMGFYWSSLFDESEPPCAWKIGFGSEGFGRMNGNRCDGQSVRPVLSGSNPTEIKVTSIILGESSLSLTVGDASTISASVEPSNATDKSLSWSSSDPSVATVDASGMISAIKAGTTTITVTANDGSGVKATCTVTVAAAPENIEGEHNGHKYVDLGLPSGTKWATCNVGASSPEEYGGYYAWGEVAEKGDYTWENYAYYNDNTDDFQYIGSEISGTQYDVAHVQWGGSWRMPTLAQCKELLECCSSSWTSVNGVNGRKFVGPNGNSIFLPAAGYRWNDYLNYAGSDGYYWSGTLYGSDGFDFHAYYLYFYSAYLYWYNDGRGCGRSVRPVCP